MTIATKILSFSGRNSFASLYEGKRISDEMTAFITKIKKNMRFMSLKKKSGAMSMGNKVYFPVLMVALSEASVKISFAPSICVRLSEKPRGIGISTARKIFNRMKRMHIPTNLLFISSFL